MTSLIAWVGVDSHGTSSAYIASDSRFSRKISESTQTWDYGRKVFVCQHYPDIFGYAGTGEFPLMLLGQITDMVDQGLLFTQTDEPRTKFEIITKTIMRSFDRDFNQGMEFTFVYATRHGVSMKSTFHIYSLTWTHSQGWNPVSYDIPLKSDIVCSFGSGKSAVEEWHNRWNRTTEGGTSRAVYGAFCDAIKSDTNKLSGGSPQLGRLIRIKNGQLLGTVHGKNRYIYGLRVDYSDLLSKIDWHNHLLERCDLKTLDRLRKAKSHKQPRGLGGVGQINELKRKRGV